MSFERCLLISMSLTAETARIPGRRSRGFTSITPVILSPMKQKHTIALEVTTDMDETWHIYLISMPQKYKHFLQLKN